MRIRSQTALVFFAVLISVLCAMYILSVTVLLREVRRIEAAEIQRRMDQALAVLDDRIEALAAHAWDRARWEESRDRVLRQSPSNVSETWNDAATTEMRQANVVCYFDASGVLVDAFAFNLNTRKPEAPPSELLAVLQPANDIIRDALSGTPTSGWVVAGDDPTMIVAQPVPMAEGTGDPAGVLVLGRMLNPSYLRQLNEDIGLRAGVRGTADTVEASEIRAVLDAASMDSGYLVRPIDKERIEALTAITDVWGRPAFILSVTTPRTTYQQGVRAITVFMSALLGLGLLIAFVSLLLWNRLVLARLLRLSQEIALIGNRDSDINRVTVSGDDEITGFERKINEMLDTVGAAEAALLDNEARLRAVLHTAADGIITIDGTGSILSFNRAAEKMFGYRSDEVMGRNVSMLMPSPHQESHDKYLRDYQNSGTRRMIGTPRELQGKRKDGSLFPLYIAVSEVPLKGAQVFAGILRDITAEKENESRLHELATFDALTGLHNRRSFLEELRTAVEGARRYGDPISVAYIDVDKFKQVNDQFGHALGDAVLSKLGKIIREEIRTPDKAGRLGGDEFCIVFAHTQSSTAIACLERIRNRMGHEGFTNGRSEAVHVTITAGLADMPGPDSDAKAMLEAADRALYKAKAGGRNRCAIHNAEATQPLEK